MFYKADIVEVINYFRSEQVGKRYRITEVRELRGGVVVYEIGDKGEGINRICFNDQHIMLYNRPFVNKLKNIFKINNLD